MAQSPTVSIPKKSTDEVDWTTPIRNLIAQSYGESPDNYASECAALQRCRQDAVRGAGSEMTARDLLYKYFGQLELLELRFPEIRVTFPWRDAFTNKLITQTSLAYEKASIIFQIAATHSAIATMQTRFDPEGVKRAFHYYRTAAGMLTYINENFLHAPSTDLSREVVKYLIDVMLAQAHEVFFEKCRDEKKTPGLIAKVVAHTAALYSALVENVKEFQGKKIFDNNWITLLSIKSKYMTSLSQYYRSLADNASGKHGNALARLIVAEKAAKEAHSLTSGSFSPYFVTTQTPTLPADAGTAMLELTKAHLALCSEKRAEAQRDNDLIYNAVVPTEATLPVIDKTAVATPIPIQEVYGTPDVQKTIGPDLFIKLIPLSVHESASVYSEEKAKLVRGEVEKADVADNEYRAALDSIGVKDGLGRYRAMVEGIVTTNDIVPREVRNWQNEIRTAEDSESTVSMFGQLDRLKAIVREELDSIGRDLEIESRDCEAGRLKYEHFWTQAPSSGLTKTFRQDLKNHVNALDAASNSDKQATDLWQSIGGDIELILDDDKLEAEFNRQLQSADKNNLLDVEVEDNDWQEREKIGGYVAEIEERLGRLSKISRERNETLKDLKEKIQSDDVSHLLLLNRRNSAVEPSLFQTELEKFKPYQMRIQASIQYQQAAIQEISQYWKALKDLAGRGAGAKKWEEKEKRRTNCIKRFEKMREIWLQVRDGLNKGLRFYRDLSDLSGQLRRSVKAYVSSRATEREGLIAKAETEKRLTSSTPSSIPPPRPAPPLESSFSNLNIRSPTSPAPNTTWNRPTPPPNAPPPPASWTPPVSWNSPSSSAYPPPPPSRPSYSTPTPSAPPPPPPPPPSAPSNPYTFDAPGLSSQFLLDRPMQPNNPPQHQRYPSQGYSPYSPPGGPPQRQGTFPLPPPPLQQQQQQQQQQPPQNYQRPSSMFPPPPPPVSYQSQQPPPPPSQYTQPQQSNPYQYRSW